MKRKIFAQHSSPSASFINPLATHGFFTAAITRSKRRLLLEQDAPSSYQLDLSLTRRELEVLGLVAKGYTDRRIAEILVISPRTVNRHLSNIFAKLNVPTRTAAVTCVMLQGAFA